MTYVSYVAEGTVLKTRWSFRTAKSIENRSAPLDTVLHRGTSAIIRLTKKKRVVENTICSKLTKYYKRRGIHPKKFRCPHQSFCRTFAYQGNMTEARMSMVGSRYGDGYPRIVVISLDPPRGEKDFVLPGERTTEFMAKIGESRNFTVNRPNPHWTMTQIIVKDLLSLFGYKAQPGAAIVKESYSGRPIENVTSRFAAGNVAKCSMNNPDSGQASRKVHEKCSSSYLAEELEILQPDILVTQAKTTNEIVGTLLVGHPVAESDLPTTRSVRVGKNLTLWLPMRHPTRQLRKIRNDWAFYARAVKRWATTNRVGARGKRKC